MALPRPRAWRLVGLSRNPFSWIGASWAMADRGYVCAYIHTYIHTYVRMYACMYVCTYIHTYTGTGRPAAGRPSGRPPEIPVSARPSGGVLGAAAAARGRVRCSTQLITIDYTTSASRPTFGGTLAEPVFLDRRFLGDGRPRIRMYIHTYVCMYACAVPGV